MSRYVLDHHLEGGVWGATEQKTGLTSKSGRTILIDNMLCDFTYIRKLLEFGGLPDSGAEGET
jgi:hypothetical protein